MQITNMKITPYERNPRNNDARMRGGKRNGGAFLRIYGHDQSYSEELMQSVKDIVH